MRLFPMVVCFFTIGTGYEKEWWKLKRDIKKYELLYELYPIIDQGDWYLNTRMKVKILKRAIQDFPKHSILYLDVDARICRFPALFATDELDKYDIAAHIVDWSVYDTVGRKDKELLNGTLWLNNNERVRSLLDQWDDQIQSSRRNELEQRSLYRAVLARSDIRLYNLPAEYCTIFDSMKDIENPVIKHYQASRRLKKRRTK